MKNISLVVLLLTFLISCNSLSTENVRLIEKYIQAVENNNPEVMESILADDYIGLGPSFGDSITKPAAITNWKLNMADVYKKIEYKKSKNALVDIVSEEGEGDWVSNWAELQITYKNNDKEVIIWANTIYQIRNKKIVKSITFYNEADVLRQLDYIFVDSEFFE